MSRPPGKFPGEHSDGKVIMLEKVIFKSVIWYDVLFPFPTHQGSLYILAFLGNRRSGVHNAQEGLILINALVIEGIKTVLKRGH